MQHSLSLQLWEMQLEKERMDEPSLRCLSKNLGNMHINDNKSGGGKVRKKLQVVILFPSKANFPSGNSPRGITWLR